MATKKKPTRGRARAAARSHDPALVTDLVKFIGRYVVMTDAQKLVVAIYVMHTWIADACMQTPYLFIHSPEPECGKSRLMEVLELLVARPWMIVNPSDAVLFRKVHAAMPTLLWDEIDAVFNPKSAQYHEEQRGMLDQGHRRHGRVPRYIGEKVVEFNVYCPKVFAGIGTLPDTLSRRSIPISLKRRAPDEYVERFIRVDVEPLAEELMERVKHWLEKWGERAVNTRPEDIPDTISDRMQEGCFSLFALADLLGVGPEFRKALEELLTGERLDSAQTMRMRLLADLREVWAAEFERRGKVRKAMLTSTLLDRLHKFPESPWGDYYGRLLEAKDMADLLRQYGVRSVPVNVIVTNEDGQRVKRHGRGYRRDAKREGKETTEGLADVWARYLGGDERSVGSGGNGGNG